MGKLREMFSQTAVDTKLLQQNLYRDNQSGKLPKKHTFDLLSHVCDSTYTRLHLHALNHPLLPPLETKCCSSRLESK